VNIITHYHYTYHHTLTITDSHRTTLIITRVFHHTLSLSHLSSHTFHHAITLYNTYHHTREFQKLLGSTSDPSASIPEPFIPYPLLERDQRTHAPIPKLSPSEEQLLDRLGMAKEPSVETVLQVLKNAASACGKHIRWPNEWRVQTVIAVWCSILTNTLRWSFFLNTHAHNFPDLW